MFLKRIGLTLLLIVIFTSIVSLIGNIAEGADKGFDTMMDPNCITDCTTYSSQVSTGIVVCVVLAAIWIWIFRRRRKNRSSKETVSSEQEPILENKSQEKRTSRSRKKPFDDSENDLFGPDDEQGSIFS